MIRVITQEDFPEIKEMIEALIKESVYTSVFDNYTLTEEVVSLYTNPNTRNQRMGIFVLNEGKPVGISIFELMPWGLTGAEKSLARMSYVYLQPEFRKQNFMKEIMEAFEYWGKICGASFYCIGLSGNNKADLEKIGYSKTEEIYMKEIK